MSRYWICILRRQACWRTVLKKLTIALAKGYLLNESIKLFEKIGLEFDKTTLSSRKLITSDLANSVNFLHVRPWDVPIYVQEGSADLGIVGLDVIKENPSNIIQLLDLKFGNCKLVLAGLDINENPKHHIKVATKYPNCTQNHFEKIGINAHLIKLYGSIELAPLTGLSDIICDLTATGKTLEEHNLHIIDTVLESSARLIANPIGYRIHYDTILSWHKKLTHAIQN